MSKLKKQLLELTKRRYKKLPKLFETMRKMMEIDDSISLIIRCHLTTESLLDELIELVFFPNGNAITSSSLSYDKKLQILSKAKLVDDWPVLPDHVIGSLRKLNSIRNRMAHKIEATLNAEEITELFMGEIPLTVNSEEKNVNILIYHYTSFIFGNLLPNYEAV